MEKMTEGKEPLAVYFADDGTIPNNPRLPVLLYRDAFQATALHPAAEAERLFDRNGWPAEWRNGIYDFHHYHSTAHEALAIAEGEVQVRLGGEKGQDFLLKAGDVLVLPAGTGHKRLSAVGNFLVVGAYPKGQDWDLLKGSPDDRPQALINIKRVPRPVSDPVFGKDGPLTERWK
jgi:uncharacterized protein YjlB